MRDVCRIQPHSGGMQKQVLSALPFENLNSSAVKLLNHSSHADPKSTLMNATQESTASTTSFRQALACIAISFCLA